MLCHQNISSHLSTSKLRFAEQNSVTPSDSLQCASSNHRRSHKIRLRGNAPHPPRPLTAAFFLKNVKGQMPAVHRPYFGWYECRRVHLAVVRAELR